MRSRILCAESAFLLLAVAALLPGQEPATAPPSGEAADSRPSLNRAASATESGDLKAIRTAADGFVAAFNRGDAKDIASRWTEQGDCIDDSGKRISGRREIEK